MSNMVANRHQIYILWWLKQATNKFIFCQALHSEHIVQIFSNQLYSFVIMHNNQASQELKTMSQMTSVALKTHISQTQDD